MLYKIATLCVIALPFIATAQTTNEIKDSLYIEKTEQATPQKVLHAEPLYIDLIRDLGARKGEREWNFGMGITDNLHYDSYEALVEYEFAPADRLGLELEVPFTIYSSNGNKDSNTKPSNRVESIKTAVQWTFFVSQLYNTSMALGYINEFEFGDLNKITQGPVFTANVFNPFLVVAKRYGNNFHNLIYTGPRIEKAFHNNYAYTRYDINTSFHYMITGTRNFAGIEFNKEWSNKGFDMTVRPQLRLEVTKQLLIGIVGGIPVSRSNQRLSTFARIIWEPHGKHYKD